MEKKFWMAAILAGGALAGWAQETETGGSELGRAGPAGQIYEATEQPKHREWDKLLLASSGGGWAWSELLGRSVVGDSLIATLAAGAPDAPAKVGEDMAQKVWRSARSDGVLVRPDSPLKATRDSAVAVLTGNPNPMVAWAETDDEGQRTAYIICYERSLQPAQAMFTPADMGFNGDVMVLNRIAGLAWRQPADEPFLVTFDTDDYGYYEVAPIRANGLVFFGDQGKFVSDGKPRIEAVANVTGGVLVTVDFAAKEDVAALFGYARSAPLVRAREGSAGVVTFNAGNGRYTVQVHPAAGAAVRRAVVEIVNAVPVFTQPAQD